MWALQISCAFELILEKFRFYLITINVVLTTAHHVRSRTSYRAATFIFTLVFHSYFPQRRHCCPVCCLTSEARATRKPFTGRNSGTTLGRWEDFWARRISFLSLEAYWIKQEILRMLRTPSWFTIVASRPCIGDRVSTSTSRLASGNEIILYTYCKWFSTFYIIKKGHTESITCIWHYVA
jgi:hypothetical protein